MNVESRGLAAKRSEDRFNVARLFDCGGGYDA